MSKFKQILATTFANASYAILRAAGWKRKTVEANLHHVSQGKGGEDANKNAAVRGNDLYGRMLRNLTRHAGEMLFNFRSYKDLPEDCRAYPCKVDGCSFELAPDSVPVIEKMRGGGIFLTAHYGNYEASGAWLCALGIPLKASFIPLKPKWLNAHVYRNVRCVKGRPYSINARTPREFLEQIDGKGQGCNGRKQLFCLLADQDSRIGSAMEGTFLGKPARTNPLPDFLLRHRPDTSVFFCWIEEIHDGRPHRVTRKILHAVEAQKKNGTLAQGGNAGSVVDGAYREWLEERIAENPALWYGWTHRRFFSKNPEIYG